MIAPRIHHLKPPETTTTPRISYNPALSPPLNQVIHAWEFYVKSREKIKANQHIIRETSCETKKKDLEHH